MASIDRKYRLTVAVEYEIKNTGTELVVKLPARDIKKRTRQVKALTKHLSRLARKGWKIETVEVNVEDGQGRGKI